MRSKSHLFSYLILTYFILLWGGNAHSQGNADIVEYKGSQYYVYEVDLQKSNLQLTKAAHFSEVEKIYRQRNRTMVFGMNAGIFHATKKPVGLLVENGILKSPLNTKEGKGNFYLKPNGVFYFTNDSCGILPTEKYSSVTKMVSFATQSGPMLLTDGQINTLFNEESKNTFIRNGVGMISKSSLVFAMSTTPVNFYTFANFFRERYGCQNALYLDGTISAFYATELGLTQTNRSSFASIISDSSPITSSKTETISDKEIPMEIEETEITKEYSAEGLVLINNYINRENGKSFRVCKVDLNSYRLDFFMPKKYVQGKVFHMKKNIPYFSNWKVYMSGIESPMQTHRPVGLYIENGKKRSEYSAANKGVGNFYDYTENGILSISQDYSISICNNESFIPKNVKHAVQAGPFLLKDGVINHDINNSVQNFRSGIGLIDGKTAILVKSNEKVTFQELASTFKAFKSQDALYCQTGSNALLNDRWYQLGREEDPLNSGSGYKVEAKIPFLFIVH